MEKLNLPEYSFKIYSDAQNSYIFDTFRKKNVVLTSEEWVRQNFLQFLISEKQYSTALIKVETAIKVNNLRKRCDIVIFNRLGKAAVIVECKAAKVDITQDVFDQIARYNMTLQVAFLIVTNGLKHFCCKMNYENNNYQFLSYLPDFSEVCG